MAAIHLIERGQNPPRPCKGSKVEWESGLWTVGEEAAQRLIGGKIYFHSAQDAPSHFGGTILSYLICQGGENDGKIIFRFCASQECKHVRTEKAGWGMEKKFVWQ